MPPNAQSTSKGWRYHFDRRNRAAEEGRHLPTLEELYCGMSFLNKSLAYDVQIWSERVISSLAKYTDKLTRSSLRTALERLTVSANLQDLTIVYDMTVEYENSPELADEIQCAAKRMVVYRVASGDAAARPLLCNDLVAAIRMTYGESAKLFAMASTLLGLMLNMNSQHQFRRDRIRSLRTFIRDGEVMLDRIKNSAAEWEGAGAEDSSTKSNNKNVETEVTNSKVSGPSIVVFSQIGNITKDNDSKFNSVLKDLVGKDVPLKNYPELKNIREILVHEFPYAVGVVDAILGDLASHDYIEIKPTILLGAPGCGKTTFSQRLGGLLELPFEIYSCAGMNDSSLAGTARRWSSGEPSLPTSLVISTRLANPLIILDEIEKAATSKLNGSLLDALLPFLERVSASKYYDVFLQASVNLSGVVWLATANDVAPLPKPLRDRCRILTFPSPTIADLPLIVPRIVESITKSWGLDQRWISPITVDEMEALSTAWSGGSMRSLKRLVEGVLAARNRFAERH
jgi:hypothetical protein